MGIVDVIFERHFWKINFNIEILDQIYMYLKTVRYIFKCFFVGLVLGRFWASGQIPSITEIANRKADAGGGALPYGGINFSTISGESFTYLGGVKAVNYANQTSLQVVGAPYSCIYKPINYINTTTGLQTFSRLPFIFTSPLPASNIAFGPVKTVLTSLPGYIHYIDAADFDGDGKLDVVASTHVPVNDPNTNKIYVFRGNNIASVSENSFFPMQIFNTDISPLELKIADLDGDGKLDIITFNIPSFGVFTTSILRNISTNGNINFAPAVTLTIGGQFGDISDIDNDGKPDIVFSNYSSIGIIKNNSSRGNITSGTFATPVVIFSPLGTNIGQLAAFDFNMDGKTDLAAVNATANAIYIFQNNSTQGTINASSLQSVRTITSNITPLEAISVADFDDDADMDFVTGNATVTGFYKNNGSMNFASVFTIASGIRINTRASDFDGDGRVDMILGNNIYKNNTSIQGFNNVNSFSFNGFANLSSTLAADFNQDSRPDLVGHDFGGNLILAQNESYSSGTGGSVVTIPNSGLGYTVVGAFTPIPPTIDGDFTDFCWASATINGINNTGGYFNNNSFSGTNAISQIINVNDNGVNPGNPIVVNTIPGAKYDVANATFGVTWDADYLYFAAKVNDNIIAVSGSTPTTGSGIDLFFNNGNGRSVHPFPSSNFPRRYDGLKDLQIGLFTVLTSTGITNMPLTTNFANGGISSDGGISIAGSDMTVVSKKNGTGYTIEGKIRWSLLNKEFTNDNITYSDNTKKPSKDRVPFGFDIGLNIPNLSAARQSGKMWNQCCYNRNWTESQYFGYLKLEGDIIFIVYSASVAGSNQISTLGGSTTYTSTFNSTMASTNTILGWSVTPTSIATISGTGLLQAINNGVVTVAGSYGTVTGIKVVTISGQCLPYNLTVTASNTSVCPIENIGFTVTGANNYTWNNGLNNGTTNIASFNPTVSGIITFVGTNQFGCISNSTSSYVVNPLTIILTQPQSTTYTAGNFATLNVSAIGSSLSYLWSNGNTSNQFTTTVVGIYQVTVSGICGIEVSSNSSVTRSTNSYLFVPSAINLSVGDTITLDVKTASNAPLEFSINDNTIANILGPKVIGLKVGNATVSVSQPATPTSDALPIRNIPLNVSSEPKRNFDIIGNNLVPVGTIIIYSQPSVLGFSYSWSFTGVGMQIISGTENTPNLQIVFLSSSSVGTIICVVRDNNQNIVSNKSLRVSTISNEEAESIRNLPKVECPAEVTDCKNSYITSVKIGKLKNENTGCSRAGYGDYTTNRKIDTLFMGDSYDLSLGSVAQAGKSSFFAVWIDYNNNGKFTDQDDFLAASFENSSEFEIKNLVIKNQDAYAGVRRLRVSMRADAAISPTDPCAKTGGSGETEDYLVFIRKPDDLEAPSFISPNRDGKNDFFLIRGINPKLPNKLTIMDRFATLIFEKENYKNDWEAKSEDNKNVQDGTYYYFFSNGEKNIKGFVEIRRK
ncbi:MAG: hypothetical protein EAZ27_09760 [Cytophagales bacterium]|nr:MAG: hypothetical protein EAZ27_09760 [Cytophagales bacterium]